MEEEEGGLPAVGDPDRALSFISMTSTFTSSLLNLGEPCLESRPVLLPSSLMRDDEVKLQRPDQEGISG